MKRTTEQITDVTRGNTGIFENSRQCSQHSQRSREDYMDVQGQTRQL